MRSPLLRNHASVLYVKRSSFFLFRKYPNKDAEGEDYVDLGASVLDFYSSLVDLLAKCAPDPMTIQVNR